MTKNKKGGRPKTEINEDQLVQIEKLASVLNQEQLCDFLEIPSRTFREICKRDDRVSAAYKKGSANAVARVAQSLLQSAVNGNTSAQIFYLKTQAGWNEKIQVEADVTGDVILNLGGKQLTPDDLGW